jgi:hypothetical protein
MNAELATKIAEYTGIGAGIFGFTTYALKEQIEYETKNGIYPDIELGDTTVEIHLLTLNEENWVLSSLETLRFRR